MTTDRLSAALAETRSLRNAVLRLRDDGWDLTRYATTLRLARTADPASMLAALSSVAAVAADARLTGSFGGASLSVQIDRSGRAVVVETSPGDLSSVFAGDALDRARDAWAGDLDAAISLPGQWQATAEIDLATLLRAADSSRAWYVVLEATDAIALLESRPFWELRRLFDVECPLAVLVSTGDERLLVRTAAASVQALNAELTLPAAGGLTSSRPLSLLPDAPEPTTLAPVAGSGEAGQALMSALWRLAAASAWVWFATDVEIGGHALTLEFFGLQRVRHELPSNGPSVTEEQARATVDLWSWAAATSATDQLLAVRQVVSLYREVAPWDRAADVQRAAESVFLALRSDAVAEAFKAQREARTLALAVARQTGEATAGLAKGAVERCLASLLAVGGVIVAQSTRALSVTQANRLHALLAVILFLLALWSIAVEGPPVTAASRGLGADLDTFSDLLSLKDRKAVMALSSLGNARREARRARWLVPVAYAASGVAALLVH